MMQLTEKTRDFIENMGLRFEQMGATRIMGRLVGLLLVADKPLSLNEIANLLRVSKASISLNARQTEQIGFAQRVSLPGDRRDFYQILPGAFERATAIRLARVQELLDLTAEGLNAIEADNHAARSRLEAMREFYQFFLDELNGALVKWKEKHHHH